jgi:uncharacterized protein YeaO (DUF488 family)
MQQCHSASHFCLILVPTRMKLCGDTHIRGSFFSNKRAQRVSFESRAGLFLWHGHCPYNGCGTGIKSQGQRQYPTLSILDQSQASIREARGERRESFSCRPALAQGFEENDLALDGWFKEVAPSDHLREWFGHDPRKWQEFRRRYFEELSAKAETWAPILERARESTVTLLYGARDAEHNNAMALRDFLTERRRKKKKTSLLA